MIFGFMVLNKDGSATFGVATGVYGEDETELKLSVATECGVPVSDVMLVDPEEMLVIQYNNIGFLTTEAK